VRVGLPRDHGRPCGCSPHVGSIQRAALDRSIATAVYRSERRLRGGLQIRADFARPSPQSPPHSLSLQCISKHAQRRARCFGFARPPAPCEFRFASTAHVYSLCARRLVLVLCEGVYSCCPLGSTALSGACGSIYIYLPPLHTA
jgi:hypothetical protein